MPIIDKSTRRDFLKRSASLAVGALVLPQIIPSTALGMGGKLPPSDRIVMGAIGTGAQGTGNMEGFLQKVKELQFVAVCDVDKNRAKSAKILVDTTHKNTDCRTYGDYREFLEKEKLDAVCIALPDHWHGLIYTAAANKKLDVYGEKPLARTIYDGRAIVSAVKRNNIVWQTGSWQRSQQNFRHAAELLFFTKGTPTQDVWFYEHPYPPGVKNYNKTKPMRIEEFEAEKTWWSNRVENEQAWKVSADDIKARNYNLDIKNPHSPDAVVHDPDALLADYAALQQRIGNTRDQLKAVLAAALEGKA